MDSFISLFYKSLKELGASPILLLAGLIVGLLALPGLASYGTFDEAVKAIATDFSQLLLPLLLMPFLTAGALGYALEVRSKGSSSLSTFISVGVKNYVKMLIAGVVSFILFYVLIFGALVFLLAGMMVDPMLGALLGFLVFGIAFLCLMAIEFYDISIVSDGKGVLSAFRGSVDFVKKNLASATAFFLTAVVFKALIQMPLSFGMAGAMMSNPTYYNALAGINSSVNGSVNASVNSTLNMTSILSMGPIALDTGSLATVALFQVLLQGFVFALLALLKAEVYLTVRQKKRITDFDYDFSDEKGA